MSYSIKTRVILVLASLMVMLLAGTGVLVHLSAGIDDANACLRQNIDRLSEEHDHSLERLRRWESVHLVTGNVRDILLLEERYIRTRDLEVLQEVLNKLFAVKQWIKLNLKDEKDQRCISNYRFLQVELIEHEDLVRFILDNPDCVIEDEERPAPGRYVVRIGELQRQAEIIWAKMGFFENLAREQVVLFHKSVTRVQESAAKMRSRIQDNDRQRGYIMWGMLAVIVLISTFVGIFIQRTLLLPVLTLTKFAHRIGGGEYGITCTPPRSRELGRLANTINEMSLRIRDDITERRHAEEKKRRLAMIVEQAIEGIAWVDIDGNLQYVNASWGVMHGYEDNKELVGKHLSIFHTDEQLKNEVIPFNERVKRQERHSTQIGHVRRDGTTFPTEMTVTLLKDSKGKPIGLAAFATDITEREKIREKTADMTRELEKRVNELEESRAAVLNMMEDMEEAHRVLKETQAQLIQQGKMSSIGTLAAGVAHEFNNILTGIMGFASLARTDAARVPQLAEIVLRESERAATITRNLLSFSRRREQSLAPASMRLLVEEVLFLTRRDFEKADIAIQTHYSETPPVMAEAGQIEQVLLNTLINAQHAMERGGTLTITVATEGEEVVVRISDTGSGIPEENLSKIFDPFFSTKGVWGKDKQAGTGLGLSVSRNIIEAHKGRIEVKSEVGAGTTFTIRLPAAEGTDGVTPTRLTRKFEQETKNSYRVLVADDEELLRDLLVEILGSLGHEVTVVSNGEAVLEEVQKAKYDYLFLDIMMPGRYDGAAVLEKIEEMGSDVKVFICTGKVEDENLSGLLEKAHGYVRKPFTMNEIASLLGTEAEKEEAVARMSDA